MGTFILILLLLAAIFGILGAVLKIALVLALSLALALALLAWAAWFWFRRRVRDFEREFGRQREEQARRRRAVDIRHVPNEADPERTEPLELGEGD